MKFLYFIFISLFCTANVVCGQKIEISSNPDNAILIVEGTSSVGKTATRQRFVDGGIMVYKNDHLPVFIEPREEDIRVDLVPVTNIIGDVKTERVEFTKLVLKIPALHEIGSIGLAESKIVFNSYVQRSIESNLDMWKDLIEKQLDDRNININQKEVDLFGSQARSKPATYLLAAEVVDMWISTTRGESYAFIKLDWSVFNKSLRKIVFKTTTYGCGHGMEGKLDHLNKAFASSATHLTCDEEFVSVVMGEGTADGESDEEESAINIARLEQLDIDMGSNLIKRCIASTVTVVTDNGHGSGVIVSDDGKILTNYHVVNDAAVLQVVFASGLELSAEVLKTDPYYDVAIIKLTSGKGYRPLPLAIGGDTPGYQVGDDVMAIGTPEFVDLGQTVSRGVVSGNRVAEDRQFIQTDVSINPGNSGGPLINNEGKVIGIVTLKKFDSEGIGFAVPIEQAVEALNINYE